MDSQPEDLKSVREEVEREKDKSQTSEETINSRASVNSSNEFKNNRSSISSKERFSKSESYHKSASFRLETGLEKYVMDRTSSKVKFVDVLPDHNDTSTYRYSIATDVSNLSLIEDLKQHDLSKDYSLIEDNLSKSTHKSTKKRKSYQGMPGLIENIDTYLSHDGYSNEPKFEKDLKTNKEPTPVLSKRKGSDSSSSLLSGQYRSEEEKYNLRAKLEHLMKKKKDLMLVKRIESKKQIIMDQNNQSSDMNVIQLRAKNTKYYMTPLSKSDGNTILNDTGSKLVENNKNIEQFLLPEKDDTESLLITKKTSRSKAKAEVSKVLKSLYKSNYEKQTQKDPVPEDKEQQPQCPKITISKIREYVNSKSMDPDDKKLHEIIKIEKVPCFNETDKTGPTTNYIINVPCSKTSGKQDINIIKIKEKRKLRMQSIEDISENVTEIHHATKGTIKQAKNNIDLKTSLKDYSFEEDVHDKVRKKIKSPTETKTLEVAVQKTPRISHLLSQDSKNTEKVLLIQYDKKSKPLDDKPDSQKPKLLSTQLLGIKQSHKEEPKEMYLYGSETDGTDVKEKATKIEDMSPTLKEKVNMIFQELRELAFKDTPDQLTLSKSQLPPTISKSTQKPSKMDVKESKVQAVPDVKSAEVQVRESQLIEQDSFMRVPYPSPSSTYVENIKENMEDQLDDFLEERLGLLKDVDEDDKYREELKHRRNSVSEEEIDNTTRLTMKDISEHDDVVMKKINGGPQDVSEEVLEPDETPLSIHSKDKTAKEDAIKSSEEEKLSYISAEEAEKKTESQEPTIKSETLLKEGKEDKMLFEEVSKAEKSSEDVSKTEKLIEEHSNTEKEFDAVKNADLGEKSESLEIKDGMETDTQLLFSVESAKKKEESQKSPSANTLEQKIEAILKKDYTSPGEFTDKSISPASTASTVPEKSIKFELENITEDIRSYELSYSQDTTLTFKSSSKFLHDKKDLRKKMNWTDDTVYLEKVVGPQLIKGLAEVAARRPDDPIAYLAYWIYKNYQNQEKKEHHEVFKEHLELARSMLEVKQCKNQERTKFNTKRYPVERNKLTEDEQNSAIKENDLNQNQIAQDA